jgi:hypothetical protein
LFIKSAAESKSGMRIIITSEYIFRYYWNYVRVRESYALTHSFQS